MAGGSRSVVRRAEGTPADAALADLEAVEPFRIKVVERIRPLQAADRRRVLTESGYNLFQVPASAVLVDLLTDSGTGAMSDTAWGALMTGDESYAGCRSFDQLRASVEEVFGMPYTLPVHQGRGAENVVFGSLVQPGQTVTGNAAFDTTVAHLRHRGATFVDCTDRAAFRPSLPRPFKGNVDIGRVRQVLCRDGRRIPFLLMTLTCNTVGGQPVSLENLRAVRALADKYQIPLFLDIARVAENAHFIQAREPGQRHRPVREIVREVLALADLALMSAKKDGLVNIGGLIVLRNRSLRDRLLPLLVLYQGFPTNGGLAGRDLAALAVGLREGTEDDVVGARVGQVERFGAQLRARSVPIVEPVGGHGVYVDAGRLLPHIPPDEFPGHSLACAAYLEGGVRGCEIGSLMAGREPTAADNLPERLELLRLAVPRRVYTDRHLAFAAAVVGRVAAAAGSLGGFQFVEEPPVLRHFLGRLAPVGARWRRRVPHRASTLRGPAEHVQLRSELFVTAPLPIEAVPNLDARPHHRG